MKTDRVNGNSIHNHPPLLTRARRCFRRLRSYLPRRGRGQGLVEFALILPLLLLVILGIIEFGYVFIVYSGMFNAAREGTRYGVVHGKDQSGIEAVAREKIILVDPSAVSLAVAYDQGPGTGTFDDPAQVQIGDRVVLFVTYDLPTITPVIQPIVSSLPVRTASARTIVSLGDILDSDGDGIPNAVDNCPYHVNPSQEDSDGDGIGDACDYGGCPNDADCDTVPNGSDNCPFVPNPGQEDSDGDGIGDACEFGGPGDCDWDGILDADDNCPCVSNPGQEDSDGNGIGDVCEIDIRVRVMADPQTVAGNAGESVNFTYVVTNTGVLDLDVTIVDSFGNSIAVGGVGPGATHVESVVEVINATTTNDVTATGTNLEFAPAGTVSDSDSVEVQATGPVLVLTAEANPQTIVAGELVTFIYTVQNLGDVSFASVVAWDDLGSSLNPVLQGLEPGQRVIWGGEGEITAYINEPTIVQVTAVGYNSQGVELARDTDSAIVNVVAALDPVVIHEPLIEGDTVVTGTAHAGRVVQIRDLMSGTFPSPSAVVQPDGTFEFAGLPPLVVGHVIVVQGVQGYNEWDSAAVGVAGGALDPIMIAGTLCHGSIVVGGTAEPNQSVGLLIVETGYRDHTTVNASGNFTFTLPTGQPLQNGQTVEVSGYGQGASATVVECSHSPYLVISPQCGPAGPTVITVKGYNWVFQNQSDDVVIEWDGTPVGLYDTPVSPPSPWTQDINVTVVDAGEHTIAATNEQMLISALATFLSPCPSPNLVITDLRLLTGITGTLSVPIATYQPLDFSVTVENIGTRPVNNLFWTDLYTTTPTAQTAGIAWAALNGLGIGDSTTLTVTLQSGFATTGTYQLWTFTDSWDQVGELDEGDNDYGSIDVEVSVEGTPPATTTVTTTVGTVAGETWVSLTGIPVPHGRANVYLKQGDTQVASTVSDENARYEFPDVAVGTYTVIGETWINGVRYSNSYEVDVLEGETTVRFIIMYRN